MFSYLCGVCLAVALGAELGDVEGLAGSTGRLGAASRRRGCPRCAYDRQDEEHSESIVCGSHFSLWCLLALLAAGEVGVLEDIVRGRGKSKVSYVHGMVLEPCYFEAMVEQGTPILSSGFYTGS